MNLIDGQLAMQGGHWQFSAPGVSVALTSLGAKAATGPAALGVRPEHVTLGAGPMLGVVQLLEQTGHENIVVVRLGDGIRLTGRAPAAQMWRVGESIAIGIDAAEAHVFGPGPTGPRLNHPDQTARLASGPRLVNILP
jgi:ABC-type sugar transport system ATPase subunit